MWFPISIKPPAPNPFPLRLQNPGPTSSRYFFSFFSFLDLLNPGDPSAAGKDAEEEEVMEEKLFAVDKDKEEREEEDGEGGGREEVRGEGE